MLAIETIGLTKYYSRGKIKALQDFNLQVETGKIFSLLGPNGAGKTTLIKLLLGIVMPTRGTASILQQPISDHNIHQQIGYLPENHKFPDFLNPVQVLTYYGKMDGLTADQVKKKIPELLKLVKLEKWEKVKVKKFSKGMLQRLGLAQAMINDPQLLFLDEPTDGIDPVGRREVRDILLELKNKGKTIFLNSHLLSEVERMSDDIAILNNGKLVEQGKLEKFISVERQYHISVDSDDHQLEKICREMDINGNDFNGRFTVMVEDDIQLNRLIDTIRSRQLNILSIIPRKISLEDFFIQVVHDEKGDSR